MAVASPLRESHTRNYEVDHVSEKRIVGAGAVRRLNVAVVLDGVKTDVGVVPRPREEMEKLAALVRSAAGVNESRGDGVALESMPFAIEAPEQTAKAPAGENSLLSLGSVRRWAPVAAGLILLALVAAVVGATRMRRARAERAAQAPAQLVEGEAPAVLAAAAQPAALDSGDLRTRAHARAAQDPATAALVLRFWLGTVNADKDGLNKS
jgi:flagellar M-ring protein FliF